MGRAVIEYIFKKFASGITFALKLKIMRNRNISST